MKKIPYGKQQITQEDIDAVVEALHADFLTQGPRITAFEEAAARLHNAAYAVAFANGTAALHGAYYAMGITKGDEVVSSPITFLASTNGALYCGARPVFADLDPATNCIDVTKIEEKITEKTKVITPIALAGYPVDLKAIREIADRHQCNVLLDAAHAIGSKRDGSFGMEYLDAAVLSFHPVKHVTAGEGGMVLTNRRDLYEKLLRFRSHGTTKDPEKLLRKDGPWYYEMHELGFNYRITDIQCALGLSQLKRLEGNLRRRNEIAQRYEKELGSIDGITLPPNVGYEIVDKPIDEVKNLHSYHLYTFGARDADDRRKLYDYLHANGITVQIHYYPVNLQPYYREHFGFQPGDCPAAEHFYEREISLPMFHALTDDDQTYVIEKIRAYYR